MKYALNAVKKKNQFEGDSLLVVFFFDGLCAGFCILDYAR